MVTSAITAVAIWLAVTAGCDNPVLDIPIYPNNYNPVFVCSITPLPLCGVSYRLQATEDVSVTYRLTDVPYADYTQPFIIPSHMYEIGNDWGWTTVPATRPLAVAALLDKYVVTTPANSVISLDPNGTLAFTTQSSDTSCLNLMEVRGDGKPPTPINMRIK